MARVHSSNGRFVKVDLTPYRDQICVWRAEGLYWREIASQLSTTRPVLARECKRMGIQDDVSRTELLWRRIETRFGADIEDVIQSLYDQWENWMYVAVLLDVTYQCLRNWRLALGMEVSGRGM